MAKDNQTAPEQVAETTPAPPAKKSPLKMILIYGVPLFLLQIVVIYFLMAKFIYPATGHEPSVIPEAEVTEKTEPEEEQIFMVKDLIVNPAGTNGTRFLLTTVGFEVGSLEARTELEKKEVQVRDMLNTILSSRALDQLIDTRQKENLRVEIGEKTAAMLKTGKLKNVYFSKFIIQ